MPVKTVLEGVRDAMHDEMKRDPRVFIMGEDVGPRGNVFLITKGFLEEFGRDRVIDTPLAEASIVGVAVGAAMAGMRPIAEIQFADFIYPAYNQIVGEAAKIRYRSAGGNTCPLVIRTPYGGGVRGALSHSVSVEALFYHVPGLKICVPSTPADAQGMLVSAIRDEDPVLFLEHKRTYRLVKGEVPEGDFTVPIGKADVARTGKDLSVITYGLMRHFALEAAEKIASEGVDAEVIDCVPFVRWIARRSWRACARPGARSSFTRIRNLVASVPRFPQSSRKKRSSTLMHPSAEYAGPMCRPWGTPKSTKRRSCQALRELPARCANSRSSNP